MQRIIYIAFVLDFTKLLQTCGVSESNLCQGLKLIVVEHLQFFQLRGADEEFYVNLMKYIQAFAFIFILGAFKGEPFKKAKRYIIRILSKLISNRTVCNF
jgi:hypothetical protein